MFVIGCSQLLRNQLSNGICIIYPDNYLLLIISLPIINIVFDSTYDNAVFVNIKEYDHFVSLLIYTSF